MEWHDLHSKFLSEAFEEVLGVADRGAMAFVRFLTPDVVEFLTGDAMFAPSGWQVRRVADSDDTDMRSITADQAVEIRETKQEAVLLLVDTQRAGAGMDGIYSAAHEVDEASLYKKAVSLAARSIRQNLSRQKREYAEQAIKKARGFGQRFSVSPWTEFDFLVRVAASQRHPGELLSVLGLWPVQGEDDSQANDGLGLSRLFVDRLLGIAVAGQSPAKRIESLKLLDPSDDQKVDLERFVRAAATKPLLPSLAELSSKPHLWVNALRIEGAAHEVQSIELAPWRTRANKVAKWSGLVEESADDETPVLILDPKANENGKYARLEIRWTARPDNLKKGVAEYQVAIVTDMDEVLTSRDVSHGAKKEEKCRFTNDDFSMLNEDVLITATVVVSVIGSDIIEKQESEEFRIKFGEPPEREPGGVGKTMRTLSEGLIELADRDMVTAMASSSEEFPIDKKGFVLLRTPQRGKSFRVFRPSLIHEVEQDWASRSGDIGRWQVRVRASGARAGEAEFVPMTSAVPDRDHASDSVCERAVKASRRMAERIATCGGGVGQIYDQKSKVFETIIKEYLLAWAALLEEGDPSLSLANTVEIQSLSGQKTIGLIVLPAHPLRVAWHVAYDNLMFHTRFEQNMAPRDIRDELAALDGAMFPAFLPGLVDDSSFVFADTLGFHTVGMVPDHDREPKAAVAILARALGESEAADSVPTVGKQSAHVLGKEILKYIECHDTSRLLHIHALRPGDGLTVARSLGQVYRQFHPVVGEEDVDDGEHKSSPAFVLELYPSKEQRGVAGRVCVHNSKGHFFGNE